MNRAGHGSLQKKVLRKGTLSADWLEQGEMVSTCQKVPASLRAARFTADADRPLVETRRHLGIRLQGVPCCHTGSGGQQVGWVYRSA